jgi:RHH-type rel operon transcriptional repressor/antitoxin RelB
MTISIQLSAAQEQRLRELAERTGQPIDTHLQELLANAMDDLEDLHAADAVMKRVESGQEAIHSSEQVRKSLGLEN